jgi:DNA topoisomerase IB
MRLRRADTSRPGYTRRRRGKAFSYYDATGAALTDPAELERVKGLVIPPAWKDVWICPDPRGHIQATGTDAAGRRQYRYHEQWRVKRDRAKFDHVLEVARHLPELREQVATDLSRRGHGRERVLAAAARLLDIGVFRIGGEAYASDDDPSGAATYGLATLLREHVKVRGATMDFHYQAKGNVERTQRIVDQETATLLKALLKRDTDDPELLAYREGRVWHDVRSDDINSYLKEHSGGCEISAKDFRTWHATVLAALALAGAPAKSKTGQRKAVVAAMKQVSEYLGNTPTVAKASYVDPRVVDLYHSGTVLELPPGDGDPLTAHGARSQAEKALLELLGG